MTSPIPSTERRKEPRFDSKGVADLLVFNACTPERLSVSVANISRSGATICLEEAVEEGRKVELRLKNVIVNGVVTNCEREGKGRYRAGIRMIRVTDYPAPTRPAPEADAQLYALGKSIGGRQKAPAIKSRKASPSPRAKKALVSTRPRALK